MVLAKLLCNANAFVTVSAALRSLSRRLCNPFLFFFDEESTFNGTILSLCESVNMKIVAVTNEGKYLYIQL